MADAVLSESAVAPPGNPDSDALRRQCDSCADEEEAAVRREAERDAVRSGSAAHAVKAVAGGGVPLEPASRNYFEPRFGHDFTAVRIHADAAASEAARKIGARAYTYGNKIGFAAGQYSPATGGGRRLIAHELAHVVQQRGGGQVVRRGRLGEAFGALWGAGPLDSYRGVRLSTEAEAAADQTGLPGRHNGLRDAWRHCYWNCRMVEEINQEDAADIAANHERHGDGPAIENEMDTHNNEVGRRCSGGCASCCTNHLEGGRLWVIDETRQAIVRSGRTAPASTPNPSGYERY